MKKTIKWGIIGLGKIAHKFATDLVSVENAELYAVASRSQGNADEFADKYSATEAYSSYEELAKDPQVDAVYIATPHSFHAAHSILCMQHKKAVLCEKPFAMNLQEVEKMITVSKEHNVLLMEALWTYFLPHYQYVLDVFRSKKFGELKELKADFGFKPEYNLEGRLLKKEVGGGSLLDIGIYPIFAALSTLGTPKSIEANAAFFETGADSQCNMVFNYQDAKAYLKSTLLEDTKTEAIFTFEDAVITINTMFHQPSTITVIKDGKEDVIDFGYKTIGYNFEAEHFNQLIREDKKESDIMTFDFSRKLIQLLDEVREKIDLKY